jgi:glutamyl/glutaminyl-tRNA synthetase
MAEVEFDEAAREKFLSQDLSRDFTVLKERFSAIPEFRAADIEEAFRLAAKDLNVTTKHLIHPLRVALSGKTVGPGMFELIEALGKEKTIERIEAAIKIFKKEVR